MFKEEGYYVTKPPSNNLIYACDEDSFNRKVRGDEAIPLEESEYNHYIPFLDKMGRKAIEELEACGSAYCDLTLKTMYDLYMKSKNDQLDDLSDISNNIDTYWTFFR